MVKEIASNYIFGLMISCTESDKNSLEYHDAKAALTDLESLITTVYAMALEMKTPVLLSTVCDYCAEYQQEALKHI